MIALYFLIALAVAAIVSVEEDEIDNSDALNVEEQYTLRHRKQFILYVVNQLNEYIYGTVNLKQFQ